MTVEVGGLGKTAELWAETWDKIKLTGSLEETVEKTPVCEATEDTATSIAFFDNAEANFNIVLVEVYAGETLIASNVVDITKTDRQTLTVIREDTISQPL